MRIRENQKFSVYRKFYRSPRKSQAALEFLTTYAWAFLVIIIMVGALAYFGVLSPSKLLPDRCNFGSELNCNKDFMVVKKLGIDTLTLRLKNDVGGPVTLTNIDVTTDATLITPQPCAKVRVRGSADSSDTTIKSTGARTDYTWKSGDTITVKVDCGGGGNLIVKEKIKMGLEVKYYPAAAGSTYTKLIFGEVYTTVQ